MPIALRLIVLSLIFSGFSCSKEEPINEVPTEKNNDFNIGKVFTISSKILEEERVLNIYYPQGYHEDSAFSFPVIYLLDGSAKEDFIHVAGLVQFMNMYELLPPSILVGIANVDRYRDFTEPSQNEEDLKELPTSGGSANFIDFLEKELLPMIDSILPSNGYSTFIGQSMGGLLATEILLSRPNLFDEYIIVSPSLWWNDQKLVGKADSLLNLNHDFDKKIYLSLGKEHPVMHEVADKLSSSILNSRLHPRAFFYDPILDEDHATILHQAVYRGLRKFNLRPEKPQ